jgi:predicted enzyme related to lactoylglutathione lyase
MAMTERVQGIGGIFFKARDPVALREWYRRHLGIAIEAWGGASFTSGGPGSAPVTTVWSVFEESNGYFAPSQARFMINYRVADVRALLATLRAEGCQVDERIEDSEYGIFGWVMDPEGHRIELWQPPAAI